MTKEQLRYHPILTVSLDKLWRNDPSASRAGHLTRGCLAFPQTKHFGPLFVDVEATRAGSDSDASVDVVSGDAAATLNG